MTTWQVNLVINNKKTVIYKRKSDIIEGHVIYVANQDKNGYDSTYSEDTLEDLLSQLEIADKKV